MKKKLTKIEVREIVNKRYVHKGFIHKAFDSSTYEEYEKIENSKFTNKQQTNGLKIYMSKTPFIFLLVIAVFFLFSFPYLYIGHYSLLSIKIVCGTCIFCIAISIYKIFSKKLYIELFPNSFKMKKKEIFWNEIYITGILRVHKPRHEFLILGLNSGEIMQIDIEQTEIYTKDFIQIINLNRN